MFHQDQFYCDFFHESQTVVFWICGRPFWLALTFFKIAGTISESAVPLAAASGGLVPGCYSIIVWYFILSSVAAVRI
jgi:hypothetical protein